MMEYVLYIGLIVLILLWSIYSSIRNKEKKLKNKIKSSFGEIPLMQGSYELSSIGAYWREKLANEKMDHVIDQITWDDLDMDKVFCRIDHCQSAVGEEYLYALLHQPSFEGDFSRQEELISYFRENPEVRTEVQMILKKMGKTYDSGLPSFLYHMKSRALPNPELYKVMAAVPLFCIAGMFFSLSGGIIALVLSGIMNGYLYFQAKKKLERELCTIEHVMALLYGCKKVLSRKEDKLAPFQKELAEHFRIFRAVSGKMSGTTRKSVSDAEILSEYFNVVFLQSIRNYNRAIERMAKHEESFRAIYCMMGELDACISVLSFRESLPLWCVPEFQEEMGLCTEKLYHPLLEDPVPNTVTLSRDTIITGSNASGKSTFIKALAVNGILAQTIGTCTAGRYITKRVLVMSSMAVRDNVTAGDSYFVAEIKSLRRILQTVDRIPCFCYIDEILKGTNTIERIAASAAVLEYLFQKDCLCVAASHDIELCGILEGKYENRHFCEQITETGILFDYQLKNGKSRTRNAVKLLSFLEFDPEIIKSAEQRVAYFEETEKWEYPLA